MKLSGALSAMLCAALLVAFSTGPLLHSAIPHTHHAHAHATHTHPGEADRSESESVVWTSLHSALRHEDKKVLLAILLLIETATFFFVTRVNSAQLSRATPANRAYVQWHKRKPLDAVVGDWLSNGISPYRRFA